MTVWSCEVGRVVVASWYMGRERERERDRCLICCNSAVAGRVWTLNSREDRRCGVGVCCVGTWEWLKLVVLCVFDSA